MGDEARTGGARCRWRNRGLCRGRAPRGRGHGRLPDWAEAPAQHIRAFHPI